MIEKLLELLLHAKAGAISGVLLIGASGALVSATTQNGVTTITVTQASPSPSASASPSPSPSPSASASPSPSASASPSPRPSPSAAPTTSQTAERTCVEAKQTVNASFHKNHKALAKMRSGDDHGKSVQTAATTAKDAKLTVKQADELLKTIRKAAVKAIHETCKSSHHQEDEDNDEDEDDEDADEDEAPKSGLVLTGTPAEIAKQATAAMDLVMAAVRTTAQPTTSTKSGHEKDRDEQKDKGKGKSKKGGRD